MNSPNINLSGLSNNKISKIREKDEYILSMTNITKEKLEEIDDEKYNQILEAIKDSLKETEDVGTEAVKTEAVKTEKTLINTDALITNSKEKKEIETKKEQVVEELLDGDEELAFSKKNENGEIFSNYKSDFKEKENKIFKNLRKKRLKINEQLRLPKTRVGLIILLIIITISAISSLFIFDPKHHSYERYKADILSIKAKYFNNKNPITIEQASEMIQIEDFYFDINKEKTKNGFIYKYNGIKFSTKEELNKYLNNQVEIKKEKLRTLTGAELEEYKQEILRDALNAKYKN